MARRRIAARQARGRRDGIDPTRPETPSAAAVAAVDAVAPSSPPERKGCRLLAHVEDEIETRGKGVPRLGHPHHQLAAEQAVAPVHRLVRKVELRGENALL